MNKHTTCKVLAEDYAGHLHRAVIRVPKKVPMNTTNVRRLVRQKIHDVKSIVGFECTYGKVQLPRRK